MSNSTVRRFSDSVHTTRFDNTARRWLAMGLVALVAVSAYLILSRDVEWRSRAREARALGLTAENNGNHQTARRYYEIALANHPYDWETHLSLARLLNYHLNDNENATKHYLYALAYSPEASIIESSQTEIAILKMVRSGELENPWDAIEDMFLAVEADSEQAFARRLTLSLREDLQEYWRGWSERGRGRIDYCRIVGGHDGFYDAIVEMDFPDGTSMSVHLISPAADIWRVELGFP